MDITADTVFGLLMLCVVVAVVFFIGDAIVHKNQKDARKEAYARRMTVATPDPFDGYWLKQGANLRRLADTDWYEHHVDTYYGNDQGYLIVEIHPGLYEIEGARRKVAARLLCPGKKPVAGGDEALTIAC